MTDKTLFVVIGCLLTALGTLLLILKLRSKPETDTFGKAARGQMFVISIGLILGGLIMIVRSI